MKHALACFSACFSVSAEVANLNAGWRFSLDSPTWEHVNLPHTWQRNASTRVKRWGNGTYAKTVPAGNSTEERVWLEIEAAASVAAVYWRGALVGEHMGAYTSFTMELPGFAEGGELVVEVANQPDVNMLPGLLTDWYVCGGLTRRARLRRTRSLRIAKLTLDASWSSRTLRVGVEYDGQGTVEVELTSRNGSVIRKTNSLTMEDLPVEPWSTDSPRLYAVKVTLFDKAGLTSDETTTRVGFRDFEVSDGQLLLNGKVWQMRGTHRHEDVGNFGCAVPTLTALRDAVAIKNAGFNMVRTSHYPPSPAFLDAADEVGLALWVDFPWYRGGLGSDPELWMRRAQGTLVEVLDQNFNHASALILGIANEPSMTHHSSFTDVVPLPLDEAALLDAFKALLLTAKSRRLLTGLRYYEPGRSLVDIYSPSVWSGWYSGTYTDYERRILGEQEKHRLLAPDTVFAHVEWGAGALTGLRKPGFFFLSRISAEAKEKTWSTTMVKAVARTKKWSESYQADLVEWHLKIQKKHQINGAHWLWRDVASPQRCTNFGGAKCLNVKGLNSRLGKPKLAKAVFQQRYTHCSSTEPTCVIDAPGSKRKRIELGETIGGMTFLRVYTNCDFVSIKIDGKRIFNKRTNLDAFPAAGLVWSLKMPPNKRNTTVFAECNCDAKQQRGARALHYINSD